MKIYMRGLLLLAFVLLACNDDDTTPDVIEPEVKVVSYSFDSDENSGLMYRDDEPLDSVYSLWRQYEVGKLVRIKPLSATQIEVANFAPVDLENVTILAKIDTIESTIQLFHIDKIRAHAVQVIEYPFVTGTAIFLTSDNEELDLSSFEKGIASSQITFDFTGESEIVKQLLALKKLKWSIYYNDFNEDNNPETNWALDMDARDARRFTALLINYGTLFISEEFKEDFLAEHIIGNKGDVYTVEQKQGIIDNLLAKPLYRCGKVVKVSGLGGGSVLGLAEHVLNDFMKALIVAPPDIISHELMHTIGFNHESNLTYSKTVDGVRTGINPVTERVAKQFFEEGNRFPINNENYYKPEDFIKK